MPEIKLSAGSLSDFLKVLLGGAPTEDESGEPHNDCNCNVCQMRRFQVPTAPEGDDLHEAIRDSLKGVLALSKRAVETSSRFAADLMTNPLSPEGEDVMLQLAADRILATVRAQHALNALLPENRRAPADVLYDPAEYTLDAAREALAKARKVAQEKYDARRIEEQAKRDAREAVEASQPARPSAEAG